MTVAVSQENTSAGREKIAILANLEKAGVTGLHADICAWADRQGYDVVSNLTETSARSEHLNPFGTLTTQELQNHLSQAKMLVTLGGDGTLLYAAQLITAAQIPVLSVNLGSLGFHTQVSPHNLQECLDFVAGGNYQVEKRMVLQARLIADGRETHSILALNDVVVSKSAWGHVVSLRISVDGEILTDISADAMIISSPTGSSAYNYAARGPVLYPSMDAIILNALCAHRMRVSPLVIPGNSTVEVKLRSRRAGDSAQVLIDGQPWQAIGDEEILKISRAPMYLPLIVFENDFYGKLRDKLRWGGLF